ncbi:methylaspartate mutase [Streptomyces sp. NA02950]|uniref:methylaspartate mutase n=1 Tax=Streptomyces sp. NA02950 TaxID=2742137 RepID=UPI0015907827|nr:methylaspartate mutase [Streptomyces sp. NA02950]QKV91470.1 methylaspartate mutase [Streptomyces sp. NA02950]
MSPSAAAPGVLPGLRESAAYIAGLGKPTAAEVLAGARDDGRVALQPRCGVGGHAEMKALLLALEAEAGPDVLTLTIDSHTRLRRFDRAARTLATRPQDLNGYPLVSHGWRRGRELNEAVGAPLEIRHGSPDPRVLFDVAVAAGITSFEGGGISYNLPYSKDVPLSASLAAWEAVDRRCGALADLGVVVDRELFGTLTAVLVPPSISLAVSVLEAVLATRAGVKCLSVAYPQGGHLVQDVAALEAIEILARHHLPADVQVHPVLHEFMGVFPRQRGHAEDLILYGALVARLGGASKLITKTYEEAAGIPGTRANIDGLRLADRANSRLLDFLSVDRDRVREERGWILAEVAEIVEPVLERGRDPAAAIVEAFARGTLDIPFSASRFARSAIVPKRDAEGAIRYLSAGALPLSGTTLRRHHELLHGPDGPGTPPGSLLADLTRDINYFPNLFCEEPT